MGTAADGPADREVFRAVYPALWRFARAVRPAGVDADDLVQEALARTLARRTLADLEEPLAYLRTAVLHLAMNEGRGRRRRLAREQRAFVADAPAGDEYPSDLTDLMHVPPTARAVLYLTVVEGLTYADAAETVGCTEVTARQMASRALKRLRAEVVAEERAGEPS